MYKVLIVEEDEVYSARLKDAIERNGYDVVSIKNPVEAVANFVGGHYDLVVSEQIMEGMNGIQMISILRGIHPTLKSIILTSNPDDETEIKALEANVDHYFSKNKSIDVTVKYIDELLRKEITHKSENGHELESLKEHIIVDTRKRQVTRDGKVVEVTRKEYELLVFFLENKGVALSREEIAEKIWTIDIEDIELRVIDGHIKRLRSKLNIYCITSIRGYGYKWDE
ncbi:MULTISPECIES: response regulator transcription factor [unclassified Breznakia]|uniref:response regulator transcription factor n=1 Tax=unclassified Breznakia TaxID=2623764 RepID=UPI002475281B|nr:MULTISPECIES: response regulator transcription factor [unclassified Breznakia]MDH6367493.1 DNA-binding response OmpR family regulator [Breznakia sp. PH1-1]MDH6404613.1 DNA-binding response OmpR family regulator [Breznakia sp. PF1-11]MDH6412322.1 DNA-binding response OmpR family regulator [Breznakia sp. PFB1-11]MDH6414660.1 DNA-binding response OmpR family regulator [Breznakia sp. PFB1-14]MDH6416945.1 DNA-binding response OmpR family regulator [Breznakia sp. PFB1-4]